LKSDSGSLLDTTKLEIYKNLPKCEYHIQGCLIGEDGRHLQLDNEKIAIWARSIVIIIDNILILINNINNEFYIARLLRSKE
jgi:hypothetical protein